MEAELLKEFLLSPSKKFATTTRKDSSHRTFWVEEFQDLSDWCAGNPEPTQCRTNSTYRHPRDYHLGEQAIPKEYEIDYYDNLSIEREGSLEIEKIGKDWSAECNNGSAEMSFQDTQPDTHDQFATTSNILDVWLNVASTDMTNEQQITKIDAVTMNKDDNVFDTNFDLLGEPIEMWFANTQDNVIATEPLLSTNSYSDIISEDCHSTSANSTEYTILTKDTRSDVMLPIDVASKSFDLLSYVCDDDVNSPAKKYTTDDIHATVSDVQEVSSSGILDAISSDVPHVSSPERFEQTRPRREKKSTKARVKSQPYAKPRQIVNEEPPAAVEQRAGKSGCYSDEEDSDGNSTDSHYRELREKNNKASRKSRINRKTKEAEMMKQATSLEKNNRILKMKVQELDKLVTTMRAALLQSALKKEK